MMFVMRVGEMDGRGETIVEPDVRTATGMKMMSSPRKTLLHSKRLWSSSWPIGSTFYFSWKPSMMNNEQPSLLRVCNAMVNAPLVWASVYGAQSLNVEEILNLFRVQTVFDKSVVLRSQGRFK